MKLHVVSSAENLETDISDCHFISLKPFQIVSNIYAELRIQNKDEASPMRMDKVAGRSGCDNLETTPWNSQSKYQHFITT